MVDKNEPLIKHADISVSETEKRSNGTLHLHEYFTVYLLEMKVNSPEFVNKLSELTVVWRRYTEFEQLHDYLQLTYPYIVTPPLPEKKVIYGWQKVSSDTFDPDFIDRRRAGLENFLLRVAAHKVLGWDPHFIQFLQQDEGWKKSLKSVGYIQSVETRFKNFGLSVRLRHPDIRFRSLKTYGIKLEFVLSHLLKSRSHIAERQYNVYKLHANYGRVFSEWSVIEKDVGDSYQLIGHYLDSLASSVDSALEDEELVTDQLKEYLFFAGSLQNICRQHELLQLQVDNAEGNITMKNEERANAQHGKPSMISRLFGTINTDEVRELRVNVLNKQIIEGAEAVTSSKAVLCEFSTKALEEADRFQVQKEADLKETLAAYAALQFNMAKKGLQTWVQIRECLQSISE